MGQSKQLDNQFISQILQLPTMDGLYLKPCDSCQCYGLVEDYESLAYVKRNLETNGYIVIELDEFYPVKIAISKASRKASN